MNTTPVVPVNSLDSLSDIQQRYLRFLDELSDLNGHYEEKALSSERLDAIRRATVEFEVMVPLTGAFNSGKSTLINSFLGEEVLKTDIKPTTAVPTEVRYHTRPHAVRVGVDGRTQELSLSEFKATEFDSVTTQLVRLYLNHPKLNRFPGVVLVDIPGLDSVVEAHNIAIDRYLPSSLAYLVTSVVDQGELTQSVLGFLKSVGGEGKPIAVAVTKADHLPPSEVNRVVAKVQESVRAHLHNEDFEVFATTVEAPDQNGIERVLSRFHHRAPELFKRRFAGDMQDEIRLAKQHLEVRAQCGKMVPEELQRLIKEHEAKLEDLNRSLSRELEAMDRGLDRAVESVLSHVSAVLSAEVPALAAVANNQAGFNGKVNLLVRQALGEGMKRHVEPVVQQSMEHISREVADQLGSFEATFKAASAKADQMLDPSIKRVLEVIVAMPPIPIPIPPVFQLVAKIVAGLLLFLDGLFGRRKANEQEMQHRIESELQATVVPQVVDNLRGPFAQAIANLKENVRQAVTERINSQRQAVQSALEGCLQDKHKHEGEIAAYTAQLERDLTRMPALLEQL
ncbi:hypothetical protein D3C72_442960 [compost metagenome]